MIVYKTFPYRLYEKMSRAVKSSGTFDPDDNMFRIEEELTGNEFIVINAFLYWCHKNKKEFGSGNYNERYEEFLSWKHN